MPAEMFDGAVCPDLFFIHYHAPHESSKNKIIFDRNMINFIVSGKKGIYTYDCYQEIGNTQALFVAKGHCLTTEKFEDGGKFESIILFFNHQNVLDFKIKYAELIAQYALPWKDEIEPQIFVFDQDQFMGNYLSSILYLFGSPQGISNDMCRLKFEEILIHLFHQYGNRFYRFFDQLSFNQSLDLFKKTVEKNALNKLSLDEMAFLCNMSLSSFKRHFLKTYGLPPHKWFQQRRLEHAFQLIKHSKAKPSDIYLDLGYENLSSFTTAFKQHYGVAPSKIETYI